MTQLDMPAADHDKVLEFTNYLLSAYWNFIETKPDNYVSYIDGFMAVHNLHAEIVMQLTELSKENKVLLIRSARDTFTTRMNYEKSLIEHSVEEDK